MVSARRQSIRQQCIWQGIATNAMDKLDVLEFIRCGFLGKASPAKITMPDWLRAKVEEEVGRQNRNKNGITI